MIIKLFFMNQKLASSVAKVQLELSELQSIPLTVSVVEF